MSDKSKENNENKLHEEAPDEVKREQDKDGQNTAGGDKAKGESSADDANKKQPAHKNADDKSKGEEAEAEGKTDASKSKDNKNSGEAADEDKGEKKAEKPDKKSVEKAEDKPEEGSEKAAENESEDERGKEGKRSKRSGRAKARRSKKQGETSKEKNAVEKTEDGNDDKDGEAAEKHDRRSRISVSSEGEKRRREKAEDIKAARRRGKNKKRIKNLAIVAVVAAFVGAVYVTRDKWVPKLENVLNRPQETVVNDGSVKKGNFPLTFEEGAVDNIQSIGSYLLCPDKNQLRIYNENGEEENSFSHNYSDPVLRAARNRMLIYDKGGSSLKVVSRSSEMFTKTVSNKIIMAQIADNNNIAVVTNDEKYAGILYIYDPNGKEIFKWSSSSNLLSVTFSEDGNGAYVTTFAGKEGSLKSVMRYFRFDSEDEYVRSGDLPTLALQAMETDNGEYWVVGDTCFIKLDRSGNVIFQYDYPDTPVDYSLSRSCAALVFKGVGRKSSELVIFDADSDAMGANNVISAEDGDPVSVHIYGTDIILLKGRQIDCYDVGGNLKATAEVESDYIDFTCIGDNLYSLDYREINKIEFTR